MLSGKFGTSYGTARRVKLTSLFFAIIFFFAHGQAFGQISINYLSNFLTGNGNPLRIAADKAGVLYVASPSSGKILKFSQDGSPLGTIGGFGKPLSVAVDGAGRVYVGDFSDGSVSILSPDGLVTGTLGSGRGEFGMPEDIAIAANGLIYVTDGANDRVKVYAADGTYQFSFGGTGSNYGQMMFPTGIAIDDANQEIYVVDHNNGRVEVFDINGLFKRTFGGYGQGAGQLTRPHGIYVSNGNVYVTDAYQSTVEIFDTAGNFVSFVGQFGARPGDLKIPMDVVMSGAKLFVSNTDNGRIEVFEVVDPQALTIAPSSVSFSTYVGVNPPGQTVQVDPKVAGTAVTWTATAVSPFTVGLGQTSGSGSSTVAVSVSAAGLFAGSYSGVVNFRSNGIDYPLTVGLSVLPPLQQLFVSPSSIDLFYQRDGALASRNLSTTSTNGSLQWTATTGAQWLDVLPASGTTPGMVTVSLNQNANSLAEGAYNTTVTVTAPNAIGSPVLVPVNLKVVVAGSIIVNTNLEAASFSISGPSPDSGSGKTWRTDEAKPGSYTIQFGFIKGYRKPATRTFDLKSGKAITLDVQYQPVDVANIIVAAKGPGEDNDSIVRVLDLAGNPVSEFKAFTARNGGKTKYGAKVAAADIDGDGTSEILVTTGPGEDNRAAMKVFRYDGTLLSSVGPIDHTQYGANVAVGDILGNGQHEVAMSMSAEDSELQTIVIYQFSGYDLIEKARLSISNRSDYPANFAFGDVNGDGRLELIVLKGNTIKIYAFDENFSPSLITTGIADKDGEGDDYKSLMTVSAGDINGDGTDEILLGYGDDEDSVIYVLKGDLTDYGLSFTAFAKGKSAPTLSSMDSDGDGLPEILAGKGARSNNDTTVRVYDASGTLLKEIRVFDASVKYGVNAVFGVKK